MKSNPRDGLAKADRAADRAKRNADAQFLTPKPFLRRDGFRCPNCERLIGELFSPPYRLYCRCGQWIQSFDGAVPLGDTSP